MASLLEALTDQLGGDNLRRISGSIGADEESTGKAVSAALPVLLAALARNSSQPDGARSLHSALEKDHDGGILEDLPGFLGRAEQGPGNGILRHVLGGRRPAVENAVSRTSGLDKNSTGQLLAALAPVILGALGKAQRREGLDADRLAGYLGNERREVERRVPQQAGILGSLLDTDGDGDVDLGDWAKHGSKLLGGFFKGR